MNFIRRVWHLINRPRFERELAREMRAHREEMSDAGSFGNTHRLLERARDEWGWNWLDDSMQDLRQGVRALARTPAFAVTAILILTFGIGLNLTLFQMANVVLLRPPKIQHPETLAHLYRQSPRWNYSAIPYVAAQQIARDNSAGGVSFLATASAEFSGARLVRGTYQSPILVQWQPAERQERRIDIVITQLS